MSTNRSDLGDRLLTAGKRALGAFTQSKWNEADSRVILSAALWELAAWADQRHPEVQLTPPQRAALRTIAESVHAVGSSVQGVEQT